MNKKIKDNEVASVSGGKIAFTETSHNGWNEGDDVYVYDGYGIPCEGTLCKFEPRGKVWKVKCTYSYKIAKESQLERR